jgi:hypothetical protein
MGRNTHFGMAHVSQRATSPSCDDLRMPPRRRVPLAAGADAVRQWSESGAATPRPVVALAVRYSLEQLAAVAPGRSVEVRVPPFGAVQCIEGTTHTRGTPPNVIETDAQTWLEVATGERDWQAAWDSGSLRVSGHRADLTAYLPLV